MDKKAVGRPHENKLTEDTAKGYQVSLTPNENSDIIHHYKSRTAALKLLLKPAVIKALKAFIK